MHHDDHRDLTDRERDGGPDGAHGRNGGWVSTPITAELLPGTLELERTERGGLLPHRLPALARARNTDPGLAMNEAQPAGVRLALRTAATALEVDVLPTKRVYEGAPPRPDGVYELWSDGEPFGEAGVPGGDTQLLSMITGTSELQRGEPGTLRFSGLPEGEKNLELWLPHDERAELFALRTDAPVTPLPDRGRRVWLHHGSSISHGSDAGRPTATWPAMAARAAGVDLVNLSFGGNALLDSFTARAIRDTPADLISLKIGINLVNLDVMRMRAFTPAVHGFLDTVRQGHQDTPLLVVAPVLCPIHEDTPGPLGPDLEAMKEGRMRFLATGDPDEVPAGRLTLRTIREELARIVAERAEEDPNLHFLDGLRLYGAREAALHPLPDNLHPNAAGHRVIGERFAELAFLEGPFGPSE